MLENNVNDDLQKKGNNNPMDSNNKNKKDKFIKDSIDAAEMVTNLLVGRDAFKIRKHLYYIQKKNM